MDQKSREFPVFPSVSGPFSAEQLARLLATARELCPRYYPLFLTLARSGCRPGEALALRWLDVNFQSREILIERALSAGRIGATKTGRSRRADMSRELAAVLSRLRKETKAPAGWIFLSREGGLINEDWPRRVFAKVLKRAQLSGHTPYDLRHTFATLHLARVIPSPMSARSSVTPTPAPRCAGTPTGCRPVTSGSPTP